MHVGFFDDKEENRELQTGISDMLRQKGTSILNYLLIDDDKVSVELHKEYPIISKVDISKTFGMDLNVSVKKNEEFFYTCMGDDSGFLVRCMLGNTDGEFYQEMENDNSTTSKMRIDVVKKSLYDIQTQKKIDEPDSLSGTRIFTREDFSVLREFINYLLKNGFTVKSIQLDELKDADIYTDSYIIKISLPKGYVDSVKDFETVSKTGALEKYINGDKDLIDYVDISFKDKVFYKLKASTAETMSSTSTTTATSTE